MVRFRVEPLGPGSTAGGFIGADVFGDRAGSIIRGWSPGLVSLSGVL